MTRRELLTLPAAAALISSEAAAEPLWADKRAKWISIAEKLKPKLSREERMPRSTVRVVHDAAAFQGWRVEQAGPVAAQYSRVMKRGDSFVLDFGEHMVGYPRFALDAVGIAMDSPVRLQFVFAETPAETAEPFDPYPGTLSRAWLQDETINIDVLPQTVTLPRRYAFRYVKIKVVDTSPVFQVRFNDVRCAAVTSAGAPPPPLPAGTPESLRSIDEVSLRTLRDCMQTVFEDGPKRDRRLWIGDLRLQALANYVTFRNYDLVKRCLYLFAGLAYDNGLVSACVYEAPEPKRGHVRITDYAALYGATLLDYARASGDLAAARDLWPVALRQLELLRSYVNADGVFIDPGDTWIFIDWNNPLHRQAAMHAVLVYSHRQMAALGNLIGRAKEAEVLSGAADRMAAAGREFFGAGPVRSAAQVSWASHTWFTLAGILRKEEAQRGFEVLASMKDAVLPKSPYLYHHVVDAMYACGMNREAITLLQQYWGGMVRRGADTFWEVYDPNDERLSPYKSHLVNSYCHAWSCTPSYFLRR